MSAVWETFGDAVILGFWIWIGTMEFIDQLRNMRAETIRDR